MNPHGIIGPRSEFFTISGAKFFNFDFGSSACLGDCSHCYWQYSTDSGARTIFTEKLGFFNSPKRVLHQYPFSGIFHDLDGTLTGKGANSYETFYYPHLD